MSMKDIEVVHPMECLFPQEGAEVVMTPERISLYRKRYIHTWYHQRRHDNNLSYYRYCLLQFSRMEV